VVSSRPPNLQKTKERLKNPQQPSTQAPESQEGLKLQQVISLESQEGLKHRRFVHPGLQPESQEGLKQCHNIFVWTGQAVVTAQNLKKG
jgi:hypothetical protein